MALSTPVAFIAFNRPHHTAASFATIRSQRPTQLFLIADGPREGHDTDAQRCLEVRKILEEIDWPCAVRRIYASSNMGLEARVSSGLNEVFSQVDRAIILEDDCVPNEDFFGFCEALLERYQHNDRIATITGDNFQGGIHRGEASYYFSKYMHGWGWATWRRVWRLYDGGVRFWPEFRRSPEWHRLHPDPVERRYWERVFDRVAAGEIDTWDFPLLACIWQAGGLTATPNANLVRNIGFGPEATHTKTARPGMTPGYSDLGPLTHPDDVAQDHEADRYAFDHHFGGRLLRWPRRLPVLIRAAPSWTLRRFALWRADRLAGGRTKDV